MSPEVKSADIKKVQPEAQPSQGAEKTQKPPMAYDAVVATPKQKTIIRNVLAMVGAVLGGVLGGMFRSKPLSRANAAAFPAFPDVSVSDQIRWHRLSDSPAVEAALEKAAATGAWSDKVKAFGSTVRELDKNGIVGKVPGGTFTIIAASAALGAVILTRTLRFDHKKAEQFNNELEQRSRELTTDQKIDELWRASVVNHRTEKQKAVVEAVGALGQAAGRG